MAKLMLTNRKRNGDFCMKVSVLISWFLYNLAKQRFSGNRDNYSANVCR